MANIEKRLATNKAGACKFPDRSDGSRKFTMNSLTKFNSHLDLPGNLHAPGAYSMGINMAIANVVLAIMLNAYLQTMQTGLQ